MQWILLALDSPGLLQSHNAILWGREESAKKQDMEINFPSQKLLLECLDEVWGAQSGADILLFQDDLFQRIRRLETLLEGDEAEVTHGFLEDRRELVWDVPSAYAKIWVQLEEEGKGLSLEALDILEDAICTWAEETIPDELAFFDAALETGHLDAVWADRAKVLLCSGRRLRRPVSTADGPIATTTAVNETINSEPAVVTAAVPSITTNGPSEHIAVHQDTEIVIPEPQPHNRFTRRRITNLLTPSNARRRIRRTRKSHHTQ